MPFSLPPDTAVITCEHVLSGERPILFAVHDEDGDWQFLCGDDHTMQQARIISLGEACEIDSTLPVLAPLPCGYTAARKNENKAWKFKKMK